ncbi:MAG: hypothetical protein M3Z23_11480 [Acidobacteriota bacterium]|nr:hypothetical protein [Acidobacteriota bacterium]
MTLWVWSIGRIPVGSMSARIFDAAKTRVNTAGILSSFFIALPEIASFLLVQRSAREQNFLQFPGSEYFPNYQLLVALLSKAIERLLLPE